MSTSVRQNTGEIHQEGGGVGERSGTEGDDTAGDSNKVIGARRRSELKRVGWGLVEVWR
jgi:hypothetical protein